MQEVPKENEVKDLAYFKDQVAREHPNNFRGWSHLFNYCYDNEGWDELVEYADRAAELYAKEMEEYLPVTPDELQRFIDKHFWSSDSNGPFAHQLLDHFDIKRKPNDKNPPQPPQ